MSAKTLASPKQTSYIHSLIKKKVGGQEAADKILKGRSVNELSGGRNGEASFLIVQLRDLPWADAKATAPAATPTKPPPEPPTGVHYTSPDGVLTISRVKRSQAGRLYVSVLNPTTGSFIYNAPNKPKLHDLSVATILTPEKAAEFGHHHGVCARCGKALTDEKSVQQGVGPHCIKAIRAEQARVQEEIEKRTLAQEEVERQKIASYIPEPEPEAALEEIATSHAVVAETDVVIETEAFPEEPPVGPVVRKVGRTRIPEGSILAQRYGRR